jgi:hypothetical protein
MTKIRLKIDVKKLNKDAFFKANSGAVYADCTLWLDDEDHAEYGTCGGITQDLPKSMRDAGATSPKLGYAKRADAVNYAGKAAIQPASAAVVTVTATSDDDDIPF